jgi:hypothetical protein
MPLPNASTANPLVPRIVQGAEHRGWLAASLVPWREWAVVAGENVPTETRGRGGTSQWRLGPVAIGPSGDWAGSDWAQWRLGPVAIGPSGDWAQWRLAIGPVAIGPVAIGPSAGLVAVAVVRA